MRSILRIGTRESELAVWQATSVRNLLADIGYDSTLVFIKSEGDIDLKTPLYEMGVQGIFTRSLDISLLNAQIDIAVHSLKDVPTQLPAGIHQAAVLKRGNHKDLLVYKHQWSEEDTEDDIPAVRQPLIIATSSIRRKAQWLNRYPQDKIEILRGNVNTRLQKLSDNNWDGAIFAAAGLERINLRPKNSVELDWMLPAPAQGAIVIACRGEDKEVLEICSKLNDKPTALCTKIERDFLRALLGGCSTPISALAIIDKDEIWFRGNILTTDGKQKIEIEKYVKAKDSELLGRHMALELLKNGGQEIADTIQHAR